MVIPEAPNDWKNGGACCQAPLGLRGNVRATNLADHGTVYDTNSHIRTQRWGALSTDDAAVVRMYVKNCLIETVDSGYGAYSIGDSLDHFSGSTLNVADVGVIMAGPGSATFTDGTVVNSGRLGVMVHSGGGGGVLTVDKGAILNTKSTAIQIKGRGGNVIVDGAQINAGNRIILQAMVNDDPFAGGPGGPGGPPPGIGPPPIGMQGPLPGMGPPPGGPPKTPDVNGTFRNVTVTGDMLNTRTAQGPMTLKFENAKLTGAISTGTAVGVSGKAPTQATLNLIGDVLTTYRNTG